MNNSNQHLQAYAVVMNDGRVLHWCGDGIFDAAHRAGYGSGIFRQIDHAEIVGDVVDQNLTPAPPQE